MKQLYFAYGSNLDRAQMRHRCPSALLVGSARLASYRLGFAGHSALWGGGVATLIRARGAQVPGLVWTLEAQDLGRLDRYEGHPVAYQRSMLPVQLDDGPRLRAHVYLKADARLMLPTDDYLGLIWLAYRRCGFDEESLALAVGGLR